VAQLDAETAGAAGRDLENGSRGEPFFLAIFDLPHGLA